MLGFSLKDEHISALFHSNNELKTKLTEKNQIIQNLENKGPETISVEAQKQTIQKLENEIKIVKETRATTRKATTGSNVKTESASINITIQKSQISSLISKINNLKTSLLSKQFKHLRDIYQTDFDYLASLKLPKAKKVEPNTEEFENLKTINEKINAMQSKFINHQHESISLDESHWINIRTISLDKYTDTKDLELSMIMGATDNIQLIHNEIFAQLETKIKSTLNFEVDAAIKKSTECFKNLQITCNPNKLRIDELEKKLTYKDDLVTDLSKRLTEAQTDLSKQISDAKSQILLLNAQNAEAERKLRYETSDKNIAHLKINELDTKLKESGKQLKEKESEMSKLQNRIANQTKTNSQQQQAMVLKCKEIETLKNEVKKYSSQQTSQTEVNKLKTKIRKVIKLTLNSELEYTQLKTSQLLFEIVLSQLESDVRLQKSLAATAQNNQSEMESLKNALAQEKKSHSSTQSKLQKQLNEKESEISKFKLKLEDQVKSFTGFEYQISILESDIKKLSARNKELELNKENLRTQHLESDPTQNFQSSGKYIISQKKSKIQSAGEKADFKPNSEYEMLLSEKDAIIAEYLSGLDCKYFHFQANVTIAIHFLEINRQDEEKSARTSCPVCFDEISEKRKWTAFHKCGHRTCCNCFKGLSVDNHGKRLCPICRTVISVSVTLEGIY